MREHKSAHSNAIDYMYDNRRMLANQDVLNLASIIFHEGVWAFLRMECSERSALAKVKDFGQRRLSREHLRCDPYPNIE